MPTLNDIFGETEEEKKQRSLLTLDEAFGAAAPVPTLDQVFAESASPELMGPPEEQAGPPEPLTGFDFPYSHPAFARRPVGDVAHDVIQAFRAYGMEPPQDLTSGPSRLAAALLPSAMPTRRFEEGEAGRLETLGRMAGDLAVVGSLQQPARTLAQSWKAGRAARAQKTLGKLLGKPAQLTPAEEAAKAARVEELRRQVAPLPPDPEQADFLARQQAEVTAALEAERAERLASYRRAFPAEPEDVRRAREEVWGHTQQVDAQAEFLRNAAEAAQQVETGFPPPRSVIRGREKAARLQRILMAEDPPIPTGGIPPIPADLAPLAKGVEGALRSSPEMPRGPGGHVDFSGTALGSLQSSRPRTLRDVLAGELPALEKDLPVKGQSLSQWVSSRGGIDLDAYYGGQGERSLLREEENIQGVVTPSRTPAHELAREAQEMGYPITGETDHDMVQSMVGLLGEDLRATRPAGKVWPMDLHAQVQLSSASRAQQAEEVRRVLSLRDEFPTLKEAAQRGYDLIEAGNEPAGRELLDRIDLAGSDPKYRQIFGDQFGGARPAAVFALGRAGIGALAGGMQGDTPGDKARNALLGAVAGAAMSPAGFRTFGHAVAEKAPDAMYLYRRMQGMSYREELPKTLTARMVNPEVLGRVLGAGWQGDRRVAREAVPVLERNFLNKYEADLMRGRMAIPEHMTAARAYVGRMQEIRDEVMNKASAAGVLVGKRENYWPQRLTPEAKEALLTQQGPLFAAIKESTPGLQGITADDLMEEFFDDIITKRFGHLEKPRRLDLPSRVKVGEQWVDVLDNSPEVFDYYLLKSGERIGVASEFGPDSAVAGTEIFNTLLTEGEHGSRTAAIFKNAFDTLQGIPFNDAVSRVIYQMQPLSEVLRGLLLTLAAPINVTAGIIQVMAKAGVRNTLKVGAKVLAQDLTGGRVNPGNIAADILQSERFGGWSRSGVMSNFTYGYEPLAPGTGAFKRWMRTAAEIPPAATGLNWVNREINKIASIAGKELLFDAVQQAKAGDASQLLSVADNFEFQPEDIARWMRDPGMTEGPSGVSDRDIAKVMQLLPARTNAYHEFAVDIPRWAKSPLGRELMAFTSIVRNIGQLAYDGVREAAKGRPGPLLTLMGLPVAAEVDRRLKDMLRGQNDKRESQVEVFADALLRSALFGLAGNAIDDLRHVGGNRPLTSSFEGMIPPWVKVADRLFAAVREQNFEHVRRAIPIVDVWSVQMGAGPLQRGRATGGESRQGRGGR